MTPQVHRLANQCDIWRMYGEWDQHVRGSWSIYSRVFFSDVSKCRTVEDLMDMCVDLVAPIRGTWGLALHSRWPGLPVCECPHELVCGVRVEGLSDDSLSMLHGPETLPVPGDPSLSFFFCRVELSRKFMRSPPGPSNVASGASSHCSFWR